MKVCASDKGDFISFGTRNTLNRMINKRKRTSSMFNNLETAKEEALFLRELKNQSYCLVKCKVECKELIWVTKKYYADKQKMQYFWDTANKVPRAKNSSLYWSDADKEVVIKDYATKGAIPLSIRLGKSTSSVQRMASKLGVRYNRVNKHELCSKMGKSQKI